MAEAAALPSYVDEQTSLSDVTSWLAEPAEPAEPAELGPVGPVRRVIALRTKDAVSEQSGVGMDLEWRKNASCLNRDPELFFPIGSDDYSHGQVREAKAVCRNCPVIAACLTWAISNGPVAGIWGGTTETERAISCRRGVALVGAEQRRD